MARVLCYDGTDNKSSESILKTGFRKGTWFARHLEDALAFGGSHVFQVAFGEDGLPGGWQFHILMPVETANIVDDVWPYVSDTVYTHDLRAMGAAMLKARRLKYFTATQRYAPSLRVTSHQVPRRIWRSLLRQTIPEPE